MAKQIGPVKIVGTIGNICFYEMDGKHYARLKSSLKGKRVKKDPAFRLTMMYAGWLAKASKIASVVYASLPEKEHQQYRTMTGIAMKMLKAGAEPEDIVDHLVEMYTVPVTADVVGHQEESPTMYVTAEGILKYPLRRTITSFCVSPVSAHPSASSARLYTTSALPPFAAITYSSPPRRCLSLSLPFH